MKWMISGAGGFIGRRLCQLLMNEGGSSALVRMIPTDTLYKQYELRAYLRAEQPDYIIHLAAYGNHSHQSNPDKIFISNLTSTLNLLNESANLDYKAFINVGSSSEYGEKTLPMKETDLPETTSFYGASKVATTYLCRSYAHQLKKPIVTIRPFSVYGPGEAPFRFIPTISKAIENGQSFKLAPNVNHDWIYVDDFIVGLKKVVERAESLSGQTINIGTGLQAKNIDIVRIIEGIANKTASFEEVNLRNESESQWVADTTLMESALQWTPKTDLQAGLKETYDYYNKTS